MTDQLLQPGKNNTRSKVTTPRYVVLWQRIQELNAKLKHQESMYETIIRQFSQKVRPLEEHITAELMGLNTDIMRIFHDSDDNAHRSLLGFWVLDNFKILAAHPFANESDVEALYDQWRIPIQGTDDMVEAQLSLLMASRCDLPGQTQVRRSSLLRRIHVMMSHAMNTQTTHSVNQTVKKPDALRPVQTKKILKHCST